MTIELSEQAMESLNKLREQAALRELTLDTYLQQLAAIGGNGPAYRPPSIVETEQLLDELLNGPTLPVLPSDFSRADIYAEHD